MRNSLIYIEVLWELFHPNTLIKSELWTSFIIILLSLYYHFLTLFCHLVLYLIHVYCNGILFQLISKRTTYFVA